jgi:aspartate aminotransferase
MELRLAKRMSLLGTESAFEVLARAKALEAKGHKVIHLQIGEPDFDTPKNIVETAIKALREGYTHYNPTAGVPDFRKTVAADFSKTRGVEVKPENVVAMPGGKPTMFYALLTLIEEGDEVIYPNPGYPIYESMINFSGAKPVPYALKEELDFSVDPKEIEKLITKKTRMIILNSPANPTGGILTKKDLGQIAELAVKNNLWVLTDEIYSRIVYEGKFESIAQFPGIMERTIFLDGHSKTYAMTGWRLGYAVMREDLAQHITKLANNCHSCTATFTQMAGTEALRGDQSAVNKMVEEFRKRRDFIVAGLNKIPGFSCKMPIGAFYAFPNVKKLGLKSKELADRLLNEAHVAALSGTAFGAYGEGYLRFSYANSIENIKEALARVEQFVKKL